MNPLSICFNDNWTNYCVYTTSIVVVIEIVQLTVYHSVIDDLIFDLINIEHKVIYETDYLIYKLENTNKRLNEIYWYKVNIKRGHKYLRAK